MQTLVTSLIILLAVAYLSAKWLPQNIKQHLHDALSKISPTLGALVSSSKSVLDAGCHSTCSSCSGCADATVKPDLGKQVKTIRLIRHL
ncbi:hypothetical protein [Undibacterium sp. Ren11W]|uniref:hypothetical protein n=1 Tax=Undibacterium sp. Ren11W TaxID=3413045 RepID=UPI003BF2F6ED